jgi:undecaprenyl diphosphate synthase
MTKPIPHHIAIIPDGNRRWAKKRHLPGWEGHRKGVQRFQEISEAAHEAGASYITFWGGSEDNLLERSKKEVHILTSLLKDELKRQLTSDETEKNSVRFRLIGRWNDILKDSELATLASKLEEKTKAFTKKHLTLLFGYDGRREMAEAVAKIKNGERKIKIDYDSIKNALWTKDLPSVDLVVRTGGEPHWSAGFMMWHTAYSQFYFTEKFWPEFTKLELQEALADYARRERRFGK